MNVIKTYPEELSKRDVLKLTRAQSKKVIELAGSVIEPDKWILYEDENFKTGEINTVLTLEVQGEVFSTISNIFIREFNALTDALGADLGTIRIVTGQTRNGREYVTCALD